MQCVKNNSKVLNKIITIVVCIMIVPLLIYNILLIIQSFVNPHETPSFLGFKTYVIVSGSMHPEIKIGDIVIVKNVLENELQKDDIISFRQGQNVVTHRIVDILDLQNQKKFQTKGDNNNKEDTKLVSIENIEGKVIFTIPFLGKIVLLMQNKFVIILVALVLYFYLINDFKIKK